MAALDSLDSLTDADRQHLAPFLHEGPTSARSTALQYVKASRLSECDKQCRARLARPEEKASALACVTREGEPPAAGGGGA